MFVECKRRALLVIKDSPIPIDSTAFVKAAKHPLLFTWVYNMIIQTVVHSVQLGDVHQNEVDLYYTW